MISHNSTEVYHPDSDLEEEEEVESVVEQTSRSFVRKFQELYCKNQLYHEFIFLLGHPTTKEESEEYYEDVDQLLELYRNKREEYDERVKLEKQEGREKDTTELTSDRSRFIMEALYRSINGGASPPPSQGSTSWMEEDTTMQEEEELEKQEDLIPMNHIQRLYDILVTFDTIPAHLEAAIEIGALCLAEKEASRAVEEAKRRATEKQQLSAEELLTTSAEERRNALKVSPEEMFRIAQLVRSGLADESALLAAQTEEDAGDLVEVNEEEPEFLRRMGLKSYRKPINYHRLLTSQMLREARTPQQRQRIMDRIASQQQQKGGMYGNHRINSMEQLAMDQIKINANRRVIAKKAKLQQPAPPTPEGPGSAAFAASSLDGKHRWEQKDANGREEEEKRTREGADEERSAAGPSSSLLYSELNERLEERNEFGPSGTRISRLPPWMKHSLKGKLKFGLPVSCHSLEEQRRELPIYQKKDELLEHVASHRVTILIGETGSGKTTQIPQYLAEAGYAKHGIIACTQPRRVAAETLAVRVAEEYGCRLGEEVGYTVRFRDMTSTLTIIKYMTDGMLLREALLDDSFQRYSVVMLDEAHERSISTDLLFYIVRSALEKNPNLKVLITSATLEANKFCDYFGVADDGPFMIEGRTFPVETYYLQEPSTDYVQSALQTVMKLHLEEPPGDILVFFTGQEEIEFGGEQLYAWMKALQRSVDVPLPEMMVLPLTATMPQDVQSKVFEPTPPGFRKVVLATNVAETSITIENLYYVIDSGFCKQSIFDPRAGLEQLMVVPISQAQAKQRAGRAGRIGPGKCYRIYTEEQYQNDFSPETVPDIMRANLFSVTLQLKAMGIDLAFVELIDCPKREAVAAALEKLRYLEALDDDGLLTPLGGRMAQLSIDPSQSKTLLTAVDMGCCQPVLTIVSMLAVQKRGVFYRPREQQDAADAAKRQFDQPEGDHLTLMAVYNAWVDNDMSEEWCRRHFLKYRMLVEAKDTREQLQTLLRHRHREISTENDENITAVRKAICAGYFFHAAKLVDTHTRAYLTLSDRREVYLHPSSALMDNPPRYVLYNDLRVTRREYITELLAIEPSWLVELAPAYYSKPRKGRRTKAQEAERFIPLLKSWETGSSWRISRVKRQRK